MASEFVPKKAQKSKLKLKLAIQGPSGSGKTEGALALATNFMPDAKILLIDTENESASLYADRYEFDTIPLSAPYTSARYEQAMQVAVIGGYDILIVDSATHQWDGEGGILRRKEALDRQGGNGYTNWSKFTPEHTAFIEFIKQLPVHTIVTMRSKQDYVLETNDRGKQTPKKVGLAPIQRDGTEYEYTIVFDVDIRHNAIATKNRTRLFADMEPVNLCDPDVAQSLHAWLDSGVDAPEPKAENPSPEKKKFGFIPPDKLQCIVLAVNALETKSENPRKYMQVVFNGRHEGFNYATSFDTKFNDCLLSALNKEVVLQIKKGKFLNIEDVLIVDGIEYADGKPKTEVRNESL